MPTTCLRRAWRCNNLPVLAYKSIRSSTTPTASQPCGPASTALRARTRRVWSSRRCWGSMAPGDSRVPVRPDESFRMVASGTSLDPEPARNIALERLPSQPLSPCPDKALTVAGWRHIPTNRRTGRSDVKALRRHSRLRPGGVATPQSAREAQPNRKAGLTELACSPQISLVDRSKPLGLHAFSPMGCASPCAGTALAPLD